MHKVLTSLLLCLLMAPLAWSQPGGTVDGAFVIRKYRCMPDAERQKLDALERTYAGKDISAISGIISTGDEAHQRAVPRAMVLIYHADTLFDYSITDSSGRYLSFVPVGSYRLETCKEGYRLSDATAEPQRKLPAISNLRIETTLQEQHEQHPNPPDTTGGGSFRASQQNNSSPKAPGRLRGTISLNNNDFPSDQIEVHLFREDQLVRSTTCDENGYYRFDKLEDGAYDIVIITDREDNEPIPDMLVSRGKIKVVDVTLTRTGKVRGRRN